MKVPKEIAEKANEYEMFRKKTGQLGAELIAWANENRFEDFCVEGFGVAQEPVGEEQIDGEYCDQTMYGEDTGYGTYYYPIEGSTQYMWVGYSF